MRAFLDRELDTVATYWRIWRKDGVALAFTTHDRDLWFGGLLHRAAPGLTPASIRRTWGLDEDGADIEGALSHDCIADADLAQGRFDGARVEIGAVDWQGCEHRALYHGEIRSVARDGNGFTAELVSAKAMLDVDPVPRTSPSCRARFCDTGCQLSPARFTRRARVTGVDGEAIAFEVPDSAAFASGELRWLDGPNAGLGATILAEENGFLRADRRFAGVEAGQRALLREGCDHTIATCSARFGNAVNFQGEPFLPGTDLLAHYPMPR